MKDHPSPLTPEQYIADRVDQYQQWYDRKAVSAKSRFLRMRAFAVMGGAIVPVLVNVPSLLEFHGIPVIRPLVTIISLLVAVFVSLESVFHYREQWKNYPSTEQLLGHEKILFLSRVGRYRDLPDTDAFRVFVERIEEAIAAENAATLNVMAPATEPSEATRRPGPERQA